MPHGRKVIYTDEREIGPGNVLDVLNRALGDHEFNRTEIAYLYDYYRGIQPILGRKKEIRPEICNKVVENRANEIVSFKVGYLMGEPVQYVSRGGDDPAKELSRLNEFLFAQDKAAKDRELAEWFTVCGTAFRIVLPDRNAPKDEPPFQIHTLDPRNTFVVRWSGLGNPPVMGVYSVQTQSGSVIHSVYTDKWYFEITDGRIAKSAPHALGRVPIIEYPANPSRLGAFEIVLPLLDAINEVTSNRLDGVEQFVQSLLMLKGVDATDDDLKAMLSLGGIKVPPDGDVKYLVQELNQSQTQTLCDHLYQTVLTVCGMPNRNGGSSTSDTGSAVIMRDGWSAAEARAKDTELMFKQSEKAFLRLVLEITNTLRGTDLRLPAIDIRFTRRNYENIQEKAQVLTVMLASGKIHPRLAFQHCGMFVDPEQAYLESEEYEKSHREQLAAELADYEREQVAEDAGRESGGEGA